MSSRREVLKGLALGSAAAVGAGLPAVSAAQGKKKIKWEMQADIVIVGSGIAGTAAALGAASKGASVIMLEKMPFKGGTTAKSGGVFWIPNNPWLQSEGIKDERKDAMRYMVRLAHPQRYVASDEHLGISKNEFDLIASFYDNGSRVVANLLETTGLKLMPWYTWEEKAYPDYFADLKENTVKRGRSLVPDLSEHADRVIWPKGGGSGESLLWQLQAKFDQLPIQILLDHQVLDLLRDDSDRIIGVSVDRGDAEPINVGAAKAVIFCTGGFTHNPKLAREFLKGHIWGGCAAPGSTGDFIPIAQRAGARFQ